MSIKPWRPLASRWPTARTTAAVIGLLLVLVPACSGEQQPAADPRHPSIDRTTSTTSAAFHVQPGVEQVTVTGAQPGAPLTLVDGDGRKQLTLLADERGQAVFAYLPAAYTTLATGPGTTPPLGDDGRPVPPGAGYTVRDESTDSDAVSPSITVLARDDHPDANLYDRQHLSGVHWAIAGGKPVAGESVEQGFGYVEVRDGVKLSVMVRLPDPAVYGPGPYPTVIEYSGYGPSNPDRAEPGSSIAGAAGFATVGVNMRGTGCSGGQFDVFNPAQQADGYDVVETVARQDWVKGHKVGMVGLSYSGITQLYVGSTRPPSLAAITPLSVIEDPWKMSWPGGIYNAGFTEQWLEERDRQAASGGQKWDQTRIDAGDETCRANQQLRIQNIDFEQFARALEFRPAQADERDLSLLVPDISVPVFLTGAWQDEQTGPRFATMLERFTGTTNKRFVLFNGHHPDGYAPQNLSRWLEFLQLYVADQVPFVPPLVRVGAAAELEKEFGVPGLAFDPDRFTDLAPDQLSAARARWEAEPMVTVRFENGWGRPDQPGAPISRWDVTFASWPPPGTTEQRWFLDAGGTLVDAAPTRGSDGKDRDRFRNDPSVAGIDYALADAHDFVKPQVPLDWKPTAAGTGLSYLTAALDEDLTIAGAGHAALWVRSDAEDVDLEVVLSEVRPDGTEVRIQGGLLRVGHRKVDDARSAGTTIEHAYTRADYAPLPAGIYTEVKVPIFPVATVLRRGSRLRLQINNPGGDLPLWFFDPTAYANVVHPSEQPWHEIGRAGSTASSLVLPVLPTGVVVAPPGYPPCPSLRGQVCRPYAFLDNDA